MPNVGHYRIWYQSFVHPVEQAPYIERLQAMLVEVAAPGCASRSMGSTRRIIPFIR